MDDEAKEYLAALRAGLDHAYAIAEEARMKKFDPSLSVEITPAADVAARVEGIVGPPGIQTLIRSLEEEGNSRDMVACMVAKLIAEGKVPEVEPKTPEHLIEQAVRTGVGILTEGVLVAPTEGISGFQVRNNPDGSSYLAIYFAGPIRSAGGTVAALAVVLGDMARRVCGVGDFRPTDTLLDRYVEEIDIYGTRSAHLQYRPPDDEIRHIVRNCPVCIDGDPTEKEEVVVRRDLPDVSTNRVRSGIALVICEGIAQKAAKVSKYAKKIKLDWSWLDSVIKVKRKEGGTGALAPKPDFRYLDESVAGRAIFAYPSTKGGWRLRYGRTRASGIMGKAVHPASMIMLDSFLAIGTQMKIERPGKSCIVTACDSILGPIVKLKDGEVVEVGSEEEAEMLLPSVERVLFLGDMLISVGDFIKSNHPLLPAAWCEERYALEAKRRGVASVKHDMSAGEAVSLSRRHGIPLHPRYTYFWHDIDHGQLRELAIWLRSGKPNYGILKLESFELESSPAKAVLEELCVPHSVAEGKVRISGEHAYAILKTMGIMVDKKMTGEKFDSLFDEKKPILELLSELSGMKIAAKAGTYIGSRMGRPEKARERRMKKSVNVLFPVGTSVDKNASITKVYSRMKARGEREGRGIDVEIVRMRCRVCGAIGHSTGCACGGHAIPERLCLRCSRVGKSPECPKCGAKAEYFEKRSIDVMRLFEQACARCGIPPDSPGDIKGVEGLFSEWKMPEAMEKGLLRAKHRVFVFRDGTCRFDATDVPLTQFRPQEMKVTAKELQRLGYKKDIQGKPLERDDQIVALSPQDIILSENGADYLFHVAGFVDELLEKLYGMPPFYKLSNRRELLGQLAIGLSPHTSAGVLARVVGFTDAHAGFAHPYFHCAKRRNTDGDEDTVMLLMDGLLNFSKKFLPVSRGGTMDAPLVLSTEIRPEDIDDEVHVMECTSGYPLEFYELSDKYSPPSELPVELVRKRLGKIEQYHSLPYTHESTAVSAGPTESTYLRFKDMGEKIEAQFSLQEKLRAVDAANAAERLLLHHFLPDLYGNLRSFSQQEFRCLDCKRKYRRVPLSGKCNNCGGKLLLTINKGGIVKYLPHSERLVERYHLPLYMKQRIEILKKDVESIFTEEVEKQKGLADFM